MIPAFPAFLPLSLDIADEYQRYIAPHPPYADFNLANRLCWDFEGSAAVSLLNGNLVLQFPNYAHTGVRTTVLGSNQLPRTIETLLTYRQPDTDDRRLELVPEYVMRQLPAGPLWQAEEDIDNHDQVLSLPRLVAMDRPDLRHYRRAIRIFLHTYESTAAFHRLDITSPLVQEALLRIFLARENGRHEGGPMYEFMALQRLLRIAERIQLTAYGVSVRGVLRAFIICEAMNETWAIGHFWKADTSFSGIYSYLMHRTADSLLKHGYTYLNTQQDLGIQGLRAFKQSLSPVTQMRKYTLWQTATRQDATRVPGTQHR